MHTFSLDQQNKADCSLTGLALIMEGVMSGCYHVCPNYSNFQFGEFFPSFCDLFPPKMVAVSTESPLLLHFLLSSKDIKSICLTF